MAHLPHRRGREGVFANFGVGQVVGVLPEAAFTETNTHIVGRAGVAQLWLNQCELLLEKLYPPCTDRVRPSMILEQEGTVGLQEVAVTVVVVGNPRAVGVAANRVVGVLL